MTQTQNSGLAATPEQKAEEDRWAKDEFVKICRYCASRGYHIKRVNQPRCQILPPKLAIWYIETSEKDVRLWGISGEVPTDLVGIQAAQDARDLLRYFSLNWHLKAANLEDKLRAGKLTEAARETQLKMIQELIVSANTLADMHRDEALWKMTNLKIK